MFRRAGVDKSVVESRLRAGRPGFNSRQRQWCNFLFSPTRQDRLWGSLGLLYSWYRGLFPRGKAAGAGSAYSPPSSAEFKNAWSYIFTPSIHLHGVELV